MDHNARIEAAIDDLESQDHPNITAAATKWKLKRETLSKRETTSNEEAAGMPNGWPFNWESMTTEKPRDALYRKGLLIFYVLCVSFL